MLSNVANKLKTASKAKKEKLSDKRKLDVRKRCFYSMKGKRLKWKEWNLNVEPLKDKVICSSSTQPSKMTVKRAKTSITCTKTPILAPLSSPQRLSEATAVTLWKDY